MGLFDSLFGSKEKTTVTDPYEHMPGWQEDTYKTIAEETTENIELGKKVRDDLLNNPQQVQNLSEQERAALEELAKSGQGADALTKKALNMVNSAVQLSNPKAFQQESSKLFQGLQDGQFGDYISSYDDLAELSSNYEDQYLEDVLGATEATHDRRAMQEAQELNARMSAATGGRGDHMRAELEKTIGATLSDLEWDAMEAQMRSDALTGSWDQGRQSANMFNEATMGMYGAGVEDLATRYGMRQDQIETLFGGADAVARQNEDQFKRAAVMYDQQVNQGSTQRAINDANREYARTAGKDATSWYADLLGSGNASTQGLPQVGVQKTEEPSTASQIFGTVANAAGAYVAATSDERAKEDITPSEGSALDKLSKIDSFDYKYKEGYGHRRDRTAGMMAQDVEKAGITGAVFEIDGVKHVDPYPVLATVVQAVNELERKVEAA